MKLLLATLLLALYSFTTISENSDNGLRFMQGIVEEADTREEAQQINTHFRSLDGVHTVRMDYMSKKFLIFFSPDKDYDEAFINNEFESLGFQIKCLRRGVRGKDEVINQTLDCE